MSFNPGSSYLDNARSMYGFELNSKMGMSPELTKAQRIFRYAIMAFNVVVFIFACVLIGVGANAMNNNTADITGQTLPKGIIAVGVFFVIVSLLGAVATYKQNKPLLIIYFVIMLILTIIELAVGIAVYAAREQAIGWVTQGWANAMKSNGGPDNSDTLKAIEQSFHCCGLNSAPAYAAFSACPADTYTAGNPNVILTSCQAKLNNAIQSTYYTAGSAAIAFAILMITGLVFIVLLIRGIAKKQHQQNIQLMHSNLREAKETDESILQMHQIEVTHGYKDNAFRKPSVTLDSDLPSHVQKQQQQQSRPRTGTYLYDGDDT